VGAHVSEHTPESDLEMHLRHMVNIKPDPRYPNMHYFTINGGRLTLNQEEIKISAEQLLSFGQEKIAKEKNYKSARGN
jgi:hypothetical protein